MCFSKEYTSKNVNQGRWLRSFSCSFWMTSKKKVSKHSLGFHISTYGILIEKNSVSPFPIDETILDLKGCVFSKMVISLKK